jgi:hypothetical protein
MEVEGRLTPKSFLWQAYPFRQGNKLLFYDEFLEKERRVNVRGWIGF